MHHSLNREAESEYDSALHRNVKMIKKALEFPSCFINFEADLT